MERIPPFWKRTLVELPTTLVLARDKQGNCLVGHLYKEGDKVICDDVDQRIDDVYLYIPIEELLRLKMEK